MALLFIDGFDAGDHVQKWSVTNGGTSMPGGRFGIGRYINFDGGSQYLQKSIPASSEVFVGFAFAISNVGGGPTGGILLINGDGGATNHLFIQFVTSTTLGLYRGATQLATAAVTLPVASWIHIELSATIDSTVGTCKVRVGGVEMINFTGNTKNGGTASTIDTVTISRPAQNNVAFDDFYLCNSTGPSPYNTFMGDSRIYTLSPNGTGSSTQFAPTGAANNWDALNEMPFSTTDYVSSATTGHRDTYTMTDLPAAPGTILATQNNFIAKKTDTAAINLKPTVKVGASVYYASSLALSSSDKTLSYLSTDNPAALYSSTVLADNPVAYWRLNETTGTTFADSSGNGYTQTILSGTINKNQPQLLTAETDAAVTLVSGARTATAGTFPNQSNITLEVWIKLSNTASTMSILDRDTEGGSNRIWQFTTGNGAVYFTFWTTVGGPYFVSTATGLISANTTYHVVATFNGTTALIYINGSQVGTLTQSGSLRATDGAASSGIMIGAHRYAAPVYFFDGSIDEVAVYNTALSGATIAAHYATGTASSKWTASVLNSLEVGFEVA